MAGAPLKPWERVGTNSQQSSMSSLTNEMASGPIAGLGGSALDGMAPSTTSTQPCPAAPPPVPSRPPTSSLRPSMYGGGYGSMYGGGYSGGVGSYGSLVGGYGGYSGGYGGYSSYGGLGGYGSYGGYGGGMYGMNRYGGGDEYTDGGGFAQQAELSTRSAFQSIESVVQTVGSVAMMLDSTFQALYNSFRAILGVADQFSRMRTQMTRIISGLAIWRALRWLMQRALVLLRLSDAPVDDLWREAVTQAGSEVSELAGGLGSEAGQRSNWPVILFFAIVLGGPWLLWRLINSITGKQEETRWQTGEAEHFLATAEYDYDSERPDELSFRRGQRVIVAPKDQQPRLRGWLLACVDGKRVGIVPANYVRILGKRPGTKQSPRSTTRQQPSIVPPPVPVVHSAPSLHTPYVQSAPVLHNTPLSYDRLSAEFDAAFTPQQQQQQQQMSSDCLENVSEISSSNSFNKIGLNV